MKKSPGEMTNYEKWCDQWRLRFLDMDQQKLMEKLPELKEEGEYLSLFHFGRKYGIHRGTGEIRALEDSEPVLCTPKLNIYTLFEYSSPLAFIRGEWVPFENLKKTGAFAPAFKKGIIEPYAMTFTRHMKELEKAFEKLGGVRLPHSDVGYQLEAFQCIPMQFLFWEGDEEFPAQANLLFDQSATDFIHEESIVSIAMEGIHRITETAGIPVKGSAFLMI